MATLGTGGKKESTEWEDILKAKGIIPEKTEEEVAQEALKEIVEDAVDRYDPYDGKGIEELDEELEEADSDEERLLKQYREKRIAEMKANSLRPRFGPEVTYITAQDWEKEVTDAGEDIFVVVHLFKQALEKCKLMERALCNLAKRFRFTKFVKCKSTEAIAGYPDDRCPTLLVYSNGTVIKQFVGLEPFAGIKTTHEHVEWELKKVGAIESEMNEPPDKSATSFRLTRI